MDVELAPLRSFDDFITGARFQIPNLMDDQRCANRVINNLLYYQTNYFVMAILIFLLVGLYHPVQMLTGIFLVATSFIGFVQLTNNKSEWRRFKSQHPILSVLAIGLVVYMVSRLIGALFVFFFGLLAPFTVIILHSSFRLRNINNKLSRFKEYVGLKRTPMGVLLEGLGQEQEAGS